MPPAETKIEATASLAVWAELGAEVNDDGTVELPRWRDLSDRTRVALTALASLRLALGEKDITLVESDMVLVLNAQRRANAAKAAEDAAEAERRRIAREEILAKGLDAILARGTKGEWQMTLAPDSAQRKEDVVAAPRARRLPPS